MEVEEIFLSCDVGPSIGLIVDLRLTCESPEDGGKASFSPRLHMLGRDRDECRPGTDRGACQERGLFEKNLEGL